MAVADRIETDLRQIPKRSVALQPWCDIHLTLHKDVIPGYAPGGIRPDRP